MQETQLNKKQTFVYGWESFKRTPGLLIGVTIFSGLVGIVGTGTSGGVANFNVVISALFFVAFFLIRMIVEAGLIKVALDIIKRGGSRFIELFSGVHYVISYILASILYSLIILAGLLLLIVPGIIWAVKFQFFGYFVVDKEMGPVEALKNSSRITNGSKINILLLDILMMLLNIAGSLAFGIGLLITIPVTMIAMAHAYKQLEEPDFSPAGGVDKEEAETISGEKLNSAEKSAETLENGELDSSSGAEEQESDR